MKPGIIAGGGWVTQEKRVKWRARLSWRAVAVCAPFSGVALHVLWEAPPIAYSFIEWICWGVLGAQAVILLLAVAATLWETPIDVVTTRRDPEFDPRKLYHAPRLKTDGKANADSLTGDSE